MFSCEFCEISKNAFFTEHAWVGASVHSDHFLIQFWDQKNYPKISFVTQCLKNIFSFKLLDMIQGNQK